MLKHSTFLVLWFALMFSAGCAERVITPNATFLFQSDEQQHEFERRALAGDIEAARAVANYYIFLHNDFKKGVYWLKVAKAHGDKTADHDIKVLEGRD